MRENKINIHRSNIKYVLYSLFAALEEQKQERVFKNEEFIVAYDPVNGLQAERKNLKITANHNGVNLPEEYTSVMQLPFEWISSLKEQL